MDELAARTGRRYGLVDYHGAPDADRVIIVMGSASGAVEETVDALVAAGEKVGMLRIRLFHPFPAQQIVAALPPTVRSIAVLDRTKEPGAVGEPLYLEVVATVAEAMDRDDPPYAIAPRITGGRYGLSSKEMTPSMIKPIFDELTATRPRRHFTVGIYDDVTHLSLPIDGAFSVPRAAGEVQAVFFGLGSDGTVGANKASVKIIGESTDLFAQGYFVYDSKKSGSITVSHLRFGPEPIRSTYLVDGADFVACHQFGMLGRTKVLESAKHGATFLLNAPYGPDEVWDHLPGGVQRLLIDKEIDFWVIDALAVADEAGMGSRINTVMQPCFFKLAGILPPERGHRADQGIRPEDVREARRGRRRAQLRSDRSFAGAPRACDARWRHQRTADHPADPRRCPRLRGPDHLPADGRRGRPAAGERAARGRHIPDRHNEVREASDRPGDPDLGSIDLHRLRQVRDGLPARHDPDEDLSRPHRSRRRRSASCTRSSDRATSPSTG